MTKIFALSPNVKEGDEKSKEVEGITISSTTPQATFYPVTLPISSIVAKKRCGTSHIFIILLSLMTFSILFYMIPDFFYKRVHHLVSNEVTVSGTTSPWARRFGRYDMMEENTHMLPKLGSMDVPEKMNRVDQNGDMMQDSHDSRNAGQDAETAANNDGEMKQPDDAIPNRFEAMKAIATLLKIPGVQQVAVVQNNDRIPVNAIMKPEVVPDGEMQPSIMSQSNSMTQSQVPFVPPMEMKEWEFMNYRRAIREWLLRREMFRRRMLAEVEREHQEAAERKMSQIIMGLQEQHEPPQLEQLQSMLPLLALARMNMVPPPAIWVDHLNQPTVEANRNLPTIPMLPPPMIAPRIPPMYPFLLPKQLQQEQQQQPAIMPIKLMPLQILSREDSIIQPIGSDLGKSGTTTLQIRDDTMNRLDLEQKKIPVPVVDQALPMTLDGTPDRDTIFKELRSRAQMQQQMSQTVLPVAMIPPLVPSVVPPAQINSDEIFRELQHRALRMQIELDRQEAEQRAEKEKNVDAEIPVLMIADTFPKRPVETVTEQTSEEAASVTTAANTEAAIKGGNSGIPLESIPSFFNIFDKGIQESQIASSPEKEQEINAENDVVKTGLQHSAEEDTFAEVPLGGNDGLELVVKSDETAPQINFIQESATTEVPTSLGNSEEAHSEPFKSSFPSEPDDTHGSDILGNPVKLLETPQIQ